MEFSALQWNIRKLKVENLLLVLLVNSVPVSVTYITLADNFGIHCQNVPKYHNMNTRFSLFKFDI